MPEFPSATDAVAVSVTVGAPEVVILAVFDCVLGPVELIAIT